MVKPYSKFIEELLEKEESPKFCSFLENDHEFIKARRIRLEIHNYRWGQGEKGRILDWPTASKEWREKYQEKFDEWYDGIEGKIYQRVMMPHSQMNPYDNSFETYTMMKEFYKMLPAKDREKIKRILGKVINE